MSGQLDIKQEHIVLANHTIFYDMVTLLNAIYQQDVELTSESTFPKRIAQKVYPLLKGKPRLYKKENRYIEALLEIMARLYVIEEIDLGAKEKQPLIISPNLQTWKPLSLYELLPFSEVKTIGPHSQFLLTQKSVERSLDAGYNLEKILTLLEAKSTKPLPQNVIYSLRDWLKAYTVAQMATAHIIVLEDATQTELVLQDPVLKEAGKQQLLPNVVLLSMGTEVEKVQERLKKMNIVIQANQHFPPAKVTIRTITPIYDDYEDYSYYDEEDEEVEDEEE